MVNLVDSNDIQVQQTNDNIELNIDSSIKEQISTNTTNIQALQGGEVYSTSEIKTNKVWIDGKSIYRRVWTGNTPSSSSIIDTMSNLDKVINIYGCYTTNNGLETPIQVYGDLGCLAQITTSGNVYLTPKTNNDKNCPYRLIVEYTKTTD